MDTKENRLALHRCRGGKYSSRRRLHRAFQNCDLVDQEKLSKICQSGCLGCGNCVKACPTTAIAMNTKLLPEIDKEKCLGCGKCVRSCPRGIIVLVDRRDIVHVLCLNTQTLEEQNTYCQLGCHGCKRCEIACTTGSIMVSNNLARISKKTCTGCGLCAEWCPQHCIRFTPRTGVFSDNNPLGIK